jgi:hypothetical protein
MRSLLEAATGVATGSDMSMSFILNLQLQYTCFKGEGIIDERVWAFKTHYPIVVPLQ